MKTILLLIFSCISLSQGLRNPVMINPSQFYVEIDYFGGPSFYKTKYTIADQVISVFYYRMDIKSSEYVVEDKASIINFDAKNIRNFLVRTNWDTIPEKLVTPAIDGYFYKVLINLDSTSYNFEIDNTYRPIFDSLFTLAQESLTINKRKKKKFILPYEAW